MPPGAPLCPDIELPSQYVMDTAAVDGPVSVAAGLRALEGYVRPQRPCPQTYQYLGRTAARRQELDMTKQPRKTGDVCGWVLATAYPDRVEEASEGGIFAQSESEDLQLAFQCISGWTMMLWRSQDEFEAGIHGYRRAPRAAAWFDLRSAYDVHLEVGDTRSHIAANRLTVMMATGNYYFCVELPEDVTIWYEAIRRVIQDHSWQRACAHDDETRRRRRWAAACGLAEALCIRNDAVGERAMAIVFHAYDIDFDCVLRVGELMMLILEFAAALVYFEGHASGGDRDLAVAEAVLRIPLDDLFDRAMRMRRQLRPAHEGRVRKDEFILYGASALLQALGSG